MEQKPKNPTAPVTKKLTMCGNSLVINVTIEAKALGLDRGDLVVVTMRKFEEDE